MPNATTYQIGHARITKIAELNLENVAGTFLYPQWQKSEAEAAAASLPDNAFSGDVSLLAQSTHSWLIQTDECTLLIDTASGNGKLRPLNPVFNELDTAFIANLRAAGVEPEDVDYVFNSHLHVDHVGWNTRQQEGRWVPTFPNARYLFSEKEFQFYANPENVREPSIGVFGDSIVPVVTAGLDIRLTGSMEFPVAGFTLHASPGHSHDHLSLSFISEGQTALFWGDVMHHPLQIKLPQWNSVFCESPEIALKSRYEAMQLALMNDATVFTTHFPGTSAGKIGRDASDELIWLPL